MYESSSSSGRGTIGSVLLAAAALSFASLISTSPAQASRDDSRTSLGTKSDSDRSDRIGNSSLKHLARIDEDLDQEESKSDRFLAKGELVATPASGKGRNRASGPVLPARGIPDVRVRVKPGAAAPIPEPASAVLFGAGALIGGWAIRRRR